jgi:hypothetical protein
MFFWIHFSVQYFLAIAKQQVGQKTPNVQIYSLITIITNRRLFPILPKQDDLQDDNPAKTPIRFLPPRSQPAPDELPGQREDPRRFQPGWRSKPTG